MGWRGRWGKARRRAGEGCCEMRGGWAGKGNGGGQHKLVVREERSAGRKGFGQAREVGKARRAGRRGRWGKAKGQASEVSGRRREGREGEKVGQLTEARRGERGGGRRGGQAGEGIGGKRGGRAVDGGGERGRRGRRGSGRSSIKETEEDWNLKHLSYQRVRAVTTKFYHTCFEVRSHELAAC